MTAARHLHGPLEPAVVKVGVETNGVRVLPQNVTPDDAEVAGLNIILPESTTVVVGAGVNGADDFVVLPALADVPDGHQIVIVGNTAGFEIRTPATSAEEINSEDCDGTKEYAVGANNVIVHMVKINDTIGWMGQGFTAIGAVVTAVVPD